MYRQKLGININRNFGMAPVDQVPLLKKIGFDAFFTMWSSDGLPRTLRRAADDCGMCYRFIHAPFKGLRDFWQDTEKAQAVLDGLYACLDGSAEIGVGLVVAHVYIGFAPAEPTLAGVKYFEKLSERAGQLGLQIAFENTEGEAFLAAVMDDLKNEPHIGFCWDSGHELCYNHGRDMLAQYGDRLLCTHLNDNLGIRDYGGEITFRDDLHLLPFDGIADWREIAARLDRCGYEDVMMFELLKTSDKDRRGMDAYRGMTAEQYLAAAYQRACRAAWMRKR